MLIFLFVQLTKPAIVSCLKLVKFCKHLECENKEFMSKHSSVFQFDNFISTLYNIHTYIYH